MVTSVKHVVWSIEFNCVTLKTVLLDDMWVHWRLVFILGRKGQTYHKNRLHVNNYHTLAFKLWCLDHLHAPGMKISICWQDMARKALAKVWLKKSFWSVTDGEKNSCFFLRAFVLAREFIMTYGWQKNIHDETIYWPYGVTWTNRKINFAINNMK